jgi:hypothetical protein
MLTITDLKSELTERNYRMLTQGDDSIGDRALIRARGWVMARFRAYGEDPDWNDDIVREATLKRALYELYSYAENEKVAADKRQDAVDLLAGILGRGSDPSQKGTISTGTVKPGFKPEMLDRYSDPSNRF